MKILFVAVFSNTSTNNSQSRGFKNAGHTVIEYNYRERALQTNDRERDKELINVCYKEKPDLVIFSKCDEININAVIECNKIAKKTMLWYMDPMENYSMALQLKASFCSFVCCALETPYKELKVVNPNTYLIPEGYDHLVDYPQLRFNTFPVSFIGSMKWDRQAYYKIYPYKHIENAYGVNHAIMVGRSNINLNFVVNNEGISDRVYKVLAAKGFLLTQPWDSMDDYFMPGKDFVTFSNDDEYLELIDYYLHNEQGRLEIAEHGYNTVQKYTRDNWAKEVIKCNDQN